MLSTDLQIREGSDCFDLLFPDSSEQDSTNSQSPGILCAYNLKRSTSICSGDSGGPLVCNENGKYVYCLLVKKIPSNLFFSGKAIVYGIVAHTRQTEDSPQVCGNTPSFFTDVYFYLGFINNVINPSNNVELMEHEHEYEFEYE